MEYITYDEFKEEVEKLDCKVEEERSGGVWVETLDGQMVSLIGNKRYSIKTFRADVPAVEELSIRLASTPIEQRVGDKLYYLRVTDKYLTFFNSPYEYLNVIRHTGTTFISDKEETTLCKTIFTEGEINELSKEYDLSLFEKIEVEND